MDFYKNRPFTHSQTLQILNSFPILVADLLPINRQYFKSSSVILPVLLNTLQTEANKAADSYKVTPKTDPNAELYLSMYRSAQYEISIRRWRMSYYIIEEDTVFQAKDELDFIRRFNNLRAGEAIPLDKKYQENITFSYRDENNVSQSITYIRYIIDPKIWRFNYLLSIASSQYLDYMNKLNDALIPEKDSSGRTSFKPIPPFVPDQRLINLIKQHDIERTPDVIRDYIAYLPTLSAKSIQVMIDNNARIVNIVLPDNPELSPTPPLKEGKITPVLPEEIKTALLQNGIQLTISKFTAPQKGVQASLQSGKCIHMYTGKPSAVDSSFVPDSTNTLCLRSGKKVSANKEEAIVFSSIDGSVLYDFSKSTIVWQGTKIHLIDYIAERYRTVYNVPRITPSTNALIKAPLVAQTPATATLTNILGLLNQTSTRPGISSTGRTAISQIATTSVSRDDERFTLDINQYTGDQ